MLQQAEDTMPMTKRWRVNEKDTVIGARSIATTFGQAGVRFDRWNRQAGTNLRLRSERVKKKRRLARAYDLYAGLQPSVDEDDVGLGGKHPSYYPPSSLSFSLGTSNSKPTRGRLISSSPYPSPSYSCPSLASAAGSGRGVGTVRGTGNVPPRENTYTEHVVVEGVSWKLAREGADLGDKRNYFVCSICKGTGKLICCDGCPQAFHDSCLGVCTDTQIAAQHQGDTDRWYCPSCTSAKNINMVAGVNCASSKPHKTEPFASHTPAAGTSAAARLSAGFRSSHFVRDHHRGTKRHLPDAEQRCMTNPWLMNCDSMATATGSERARLDGAAERHMGQWTLHGETGRPIAPRREYRKERRLPYAAAPAFVPATYDDNSRDDDTGTTSSKGTIPITPCFPSPRTEMMFPRSAQRPSAPVPSAPFTRRNVAMGRTSPEYQPGNPMMDEDDLGILASVSLAPEGWAAGMRGSLESVPSVRARHSAGSRKDGDHGAGARADGGWRVNEMNGSHPARTTVSDRNSRGKPRLGKKDSLRKENRVWNRRHMRATQEGEREVCSYCGDRPEGGLMVCSARKGRSVHTVCFPCLEKDGITTSDLARGRVKWKGCLKCDELPHRRCSGRSRSKPQRFEGGFVESGGEVLEA